MTTDKEPKKIYRTYQIQIKKGHKLYRYFEFITKNANNLYNVTNFYIRQVYTALHNDTVLQPLQKQVMNTITSNLDKMNENQWLAFKKNLKNRLKKEKLKPVEKQKVLKPNLFELPTKENAYLSYYFLDCLFKTMKQADYLSLPGQVNQQVIRNVMQNWTSFSHSMNDYKKHPEKYQAKPSIPNYLTKGGKKEITFSNQICKLTKDKRLRFPGIKSKLNIGKLVDRKGIHQQTRVIPNDDSFTLELVFCLGEKQEIVSPQKRLMSMDLGVENLATLVFNTEKAPVIFKGSNIKSLNQWYNKLRSLYYAALRNGKKTNEGNFHSNKLRQLDSKRRLQMKDAFHKVSFQIVKLAEQENIDTIIIGKNIGWKQKSELGKKNNQNFVQIPHRILIQLLTYKAEAKGIQVMTHEESYTSKASFLDEDEIPTYQSGNQINYIFSGKRITRGLYRSKDWNVN